MGGLWGGVWGWRGGSVPMGWDSGAELSLRYGCGWAMGPGGGGICEPGGHMWGGGGLGRCRGRAKGGHLGTGWGWETRGDGTAKVPAPLSAPSPSGPIRSLRTHCDPPHLPVPSAHGGGSLRRPPKSGTRRWDRDPERDRGRDRDRQRSDPGPPHRPPSVAAAAAAGGSWPGRAPPSAAIWARGNHAPSGHSHAPVCQTTPTMTITTPPTALTTPSFSDSHAQSRLDTPPLQ